MIDLVKLSAFSEDFFVKSINKYANNDLVQKLLSHLSGKEAFHQPNFIAKIKETASLLEDMSGNYFELSEMLKELNKVSEAIADDYEIEPDVNNMRFEEAVNEITDALKLVNQKKLKEAQGINKVLSDEAKVKEAIQQILADELKDEEFTTSIDSVLEGEEGGSEGPSLSEETVSEEAKMEPDLLEPEESRSEEDTTDEDFTAPTDEEYTSLEDEYGTGYGKSVETGVSINKVKMTKDKMAAAEKLSRNFIKDLTSTLRRNPDYLGSLENQNKAVVEKLTEQILSLEKEYDVNRGKFTPAKLFELESKKEQIKQQIYQINKHYAKNIVSVERLMKHRAKLKEWWKSKVKDTEVGYGQRQHKQQKDLNARFREKAYIVLDYLKDYMKQELEVSPNFENAFDTVYSAMNQAGKVSEIADSFLATEIGQLIDNDYVIMTDFMKNLRNKGLFAKFNLSDPNIKDELTFDNLYKRGKEIIGTDGKFVKEVIHKHLYDWYKDKEQNRIHKRELVSGEGGAENQLRIDINADFAETIRLIVKYVLDNVDKKELPKFRANTKPLIREVAQALINGGFNKNEELIRLAREYDATPDKKRRLQIKEEVKQLEPVKGAIEGIVEVKRVAAFETANIPQFSRSNRGGGITPKSSSYIGHLINKFAAYEEI